MFLFQQYILKRMSEGRGCSVVLTECKRLCTVLAASVVLLMLSLTGCGGDMTVEDSGPSYYFSITTIDQNDGESDLSNVVAIQTYKVPQSTLIWDQTAILFKRGYPDSSRCEDLPSLCGCFSGQVPDHL